MFPMRNNNAKNHQYHIISLNDPSSAITEQYRKLRTNIDYSTFNKELKVMNVTSAFAGEGKTVTALNLASVYSQAGQKTLIIDMDLRKPKVHRGFNLSNSKGLTDIITKDKEKGTIIQKITDTLHVLSTGEKMPFPSEFLMSKKLKSLITELKQQYDRVIIDCPPMTAVTDASIISKLTDGTIVIIASRKTPVEVAKTIMKNLQENGANIIGTVLTRVRRKDQKYISGYYYSDYSDDN